MRAVLCLVMALSAVPTAALADSAQDDFDKRFEEMQRRAQQRFDEAEKRIDEADRRFDDARERADERFERARQRFDRPMPFESWFRKLESDPESAIGWAIGLMGAFVLLPLILFFGNLAILTVL